MRGKLCDMKTTPAAQDCVEVPEDAVQANQTASGYTLYSLGKECAPNVCALLILVINQWHVIPWIRFKEIPADSAWRTAALSGRDIPYCFLLYFRH